MQFKLITLNCHFCEKEYIGRTYQKYCSTKCQEANYYLRMKERRKKFRREVKCDNCGEIFLTKRLNAKRCSAICAEAYRREYSLERNRKFKENRKQLNLTCVVCDKEFQNHFFKKTCSKHCATENQKYFYRKKELERKRKSESALALHKYVQRIWPLTTNSSIPVSEFSWPPTREELQKATAEFLNAGGEIRHLKDNVETNLLLDNRWIKIENLKEDAENELLGRIKVL